MELKKKFMIKKIISILCLAVVVLLFFSGWITVCSSDFKKEFRSVIKELKEEVDIDKDEMEEVEEELETYGINFSVKKFVKNVKKILNTVEDLSLSPKEVVGLTLPSFRLLNMLEKFEGNNFFWGNLHTVREALHMATVFCMVNTVVSTLTISIIIIYIIMHIYNGKGMGLPILILQILSTLIMALTTYIININATGELGQRVVKLTAAPIIALILLITSYILWSFAWKDYATLKRQTAVRNIQNTNNSQYVMNGLNASATYTSNTYYSQDVSNMPQQPVRRFCTNCGQEIGPGAAFCCKCGTPVPR